MWLAVVHIWGGVVVKECDSEAEALQKAKEIDENEFRSYPNQKRRIVIYEVTQKKMVQGEPH